MNTKTVVGISAAALVLFSIIALWSYVTVIGIVLLTLGVVAATTFIGLEAYAKLTAIQVQRTAIIPVKEKRVVAIDEPAVPQIAAPKGVGDLLESQHYVVAFTGDGAPVGSKEIRTTGILGMPGGGKTVTTFTLLSQIIQMRQGNVRFIVTDPHMNGETGESLVERFGRFSEFMLTKAQVAQTVPQSDKQYRAALRADLPNPIEGGQELLDWNRIIRLEVARRKQGKKGPTWVIVIDEFSSVMRGRDEIKKSTNAMLKDITQEARKFDIHAIVIGQDWRASAVGDTDVRNTIPLWLVHQSNAQWSAAVLPTSLSRNTATLNKGEAIVVGSDGYSGKCHVRMTTEEEREALVDRYGPNVYNVQIEQEDPHRVPTQPLLAEGAIVVSAEEVESEQEDVLPPFDHDEFECVMAAIHQGLDHTDTAKQVWGVKSGPELTLKRQLVSEMIRWQLKRAK